MYDHDDVEPHGDYNINCIMIDSDDGIFFAILSNKDFEFRCTDYKSPFSLPIKHIKTGQAFNVEKKSHMDGQTIRATLLDIQSYKKILDNDKILIELGKDHENIIDMLKENINEIRTDKIDKII